jgi:hypothetical protein
MDAMTNVFGQDAAITEEVEGNVKNAAKKERLSKMKEAWHQTINEVPDYQSKLRTLSNSIEVVNTLGYGEGGNIVVDKKNSGKSADGKDRALTATSQIVGYAVKNIGDTPITYKTKVWKKVGDVYEGEVVERTFAPGTVIYLNRVYMTMMCTRPEISFTLANGKIVASSKRISNDGNPSAEKIEEELAAHYFTFNKDENGNKKEVNSDEVKKAIADKVGDTWVVKDEYVETFGYFNNPKATKASTKKTGAPAYTTQDLAANYINTLIQKNDF